MLALLFAVAAAFASQTKSEENVTAYMDVPGSPPCEVQSNCGASSGNACQFTPKNIDCSNLEAFRIQ